MRRVLLPAAAAGASRRMRWFVGLWAVRGLSTAPDAAAGGTKMSGFEFSTPNFSLDGGVDVGADDVVRDLVTSPVTDLDFVRDVYGPWLVLTEELQGELFVDHDRMVYLRPANGLGFGVGRIEVAEPGTAGTAFSLQLESYTYPVTSVMAPYAPTALEVTGLLKRVESTSGEYATFSLVATWRKKDGTSGKFNAAKLSPWDPATSAKPWEPRAELQSIFHEVFPKPLVLTSHLRRSQAAREASGDPGRAQPHHLSLEPYHVGDVPGLHYIPNYISEDEEQQILQLVKDTPKELKTQLEKRTVQEWGCTMCEECNKSFVADRNMPPWVDACNDMLLHDGIFTPSTFPNSVRVHEYQVGEGIGAHCDGPIYVPLVSVLSLNSPCVMFFYARREPYAQPMEHYNDTFRFDTGIAVEKPLQFVVMEPRSLLLFRGDAYYYHPHGTSDREVDELSPDVAGKLVNRHLLQDPSITEVKKSYRVSITTRNLLPRCNHQPTRAEYGMKRAWYVYNQLPVPEPLVTPAPLPPTPASTTTTNTTTTTTVSGKMQEHKDTSVAAAAVKADSDINFSDLEKKLDALLTQQSSLVEQVGELRQLMANEATFRSEVSTVLNHLSSTMLDIDSKLEDREEREASSK
ncbi:alkylated DNA repair protein alkB like protein 6 [Trypanosoma conorhini]|uniref:Alkylated DNA repair protein alkB like protein 6 n=1 Tax=Trypanosoma conorhini TaxID=83891 RepID=A0A422NQD8_9TRYP|nr:alkylated DNA repair protein alkB like protein 6 [Trypanosoma conorhini]RNF07609.1 alkylated DNA repair protein alkB like protein 6 [Trypanosoma conorhini]